MTTAKQTTTLGQVESELAYMEQNFTDKIEQAGKLFCAPDGTIHFEGSEIIVPDNSLVQLGQRINIPKPAHLVDYRNLDMELFANSFNHFIARRNDKELFFRFDNNRARAILTPSYKPVSNLEIVSTLLKEGIYSPDEKVTTYHTDDYFRLDFKKPDRHEFGKVGDEIQGGIGVINSETGARTLSIASVIYRLICSNGMITGTKQNGTTKRHRGNWDSSTIIVDAISKASNGLNLDAWKRAMDKEFNPQDLEKIHKRLGITKKQGEIIKSAYGNPINGTQDNVFRLVNAITWAATHEDRLSMDVKHDLQVSAGKILQAA